MPDKLRLRSKEETREDRPYSYHGNSCDIQSCSNWKDVCKLDEISKTVKSFVLNFAEKTEKFWKTLCITSNHYNLWVVFVKSDKKVILYRYFCFQRPLPICLYHHMKLIDNLLKNSIPSLSHNPIAPKWPNVSWGNRSTIGEEFWPDLIVFQRMRYWSQVELKLEIRCQKLCIEFIALLR